MLSGNLGYQGKAKTGPTHGAAAGFVYAEKRVEDFLLVFRRDADSGVLYQNEGTVVFRADGDSDGSVGAVVFDGILHKVVDSAVEEDVASGYSAVLGIKKQCDSSLLGNGIQVTKYFVCQFCQ